MKRILGIDLGIGSLGWAMISVDELNENAPVEVLGLGSRIMNLTADETTGFTKGNGESVNSQRTFARSARRNLDRFQQRRRLLARWLDLYGLQFDDSLLRLSPVELWNLRAEAATDKKLTLPQLGRVLYHMNMRRGYRSSKSDNDGDKKQSDYLAAISERAAEAREAGETPGQFFARHLNESVYTTGSGRKACNYRIKEKVFPRSAYEAELNTILESQRRHYPELLTDEACARIHNAIFFQRGLKSCKHLVSLCEFESREYTFGDRTVICGPRNAPESSPLAQYCRILETVNNITLKNSTNKRNSGSDTLLHDRRQSYIYPIRADERRQMYDFLNTHERMTAANVLSMVGLKKTDGFSFDKNVGKGIPGNKTYSALRKALEPYFSESQIRALLSFKPEIVDTDRVDIETGEVLRSISSSYRHMPLYRLWHTVYSISDHDELTKALSHMEFDGDDGEKIKLTDPGLIDTLFKIDFRGMGYANKSAKFMCRIIPYLLDGLHYSEACEMVGVNHSNSLTSQANAERQLKDRLTLLQKGELRQPVVEKILNQLVHQVNSVIERWGPIDEIRVELARELKKNKAQRADIFARNARLENEAKSIAETITSELQMRPTRNRIQKYRMWKESECCCMYCGAPVGLRSFLEGVDAEKEHVIPRSLFFDDSFSNKVCACRDCNQAKGQMTGYDFMKAQSDEKFQSYVARVERLAADGFKSNGKTGISRTKRDRLLTGRSEIPTDFIDRDLRLSQYIARKAMSMLGEVCRNVYASSGSVTDFFRHAWGYDTILHSLNLPAYSAAGMTETVQTEHRGNILSEERICGWSKRLDHRHHAIDALTIALTRQSYVQRLNSLNAIADESANGAPSKTEGRSTNLEKWAASMPHFSHSEVLKAVSDIAVSFRPAKRATTPGKRKVRQGGKSITVQRDLCIPRGPLSEESVYGKTRTMLRGCPLKQLFADPESICSPTVRTAVTSRLVEHGGDAKAAERSCRKQPLTVNGETVTQASMWQTNVVIRYPLTSIKFKNIDRIVDGRARQAVRERFAAVGNSDTEFVKSLDREPIYLDAGHNLQVKSVRCEARPSVDSLTPVRRLADGTPIGWSAYGSNHHIALYATDNGQHIVESVVPLFHAVRRRQLGLPVVVTDPESLWQRLDQFDPDSLDNDLLSRMPAPDSRFLFSMSINDMFLLGLSSSEAAEMIADGRKSELAAHLYRVQKLSSWSYCFKKHTCTVSDTDSAQISLGNYVRITSEGALRSANPIKVTVSRLGDISLKS